MTRKDYEMTDDDRWKELREAEAKATPGPYIRSGVRQKNNTDSIWVGQDGFLIAGFPIGYRPHEQAGAIADAEFYRLARRDVAALLEECDRQKAVIAALYSELAALKLNEEDEGYDESF